MSMMLKVKWISKTSHPSNNKNLLKFELVREQLRKTNSLNRACGVIGKHARLRI